MADVKKIVVTGVPCRGKTACLQYVRQHYADKGYYVIVCPDSETLLANQGICNDNSIPFLAKAVEKQIEAENSLTNDINNDDRNTIVLFDGGVVDYFSCADAEELSRITGVNPIAAWYRYDAALFLDTAAKNDEELCRRDRLLAQWMGHPHLRSIPGCCSTESMAEHIVGEMDGILSDIEVEKKFLIKYPEEAVLRRYGARKIDISQTYLLSDIGSHRIRMRGCGGVVAYYETVKIRIHANSCHEFENTVTADEYNMLMQKADPDKHTIVKERYCFLFKGQYIELDIFPFWRDQALLEIELLDDDCGYELPPEIQVIADVSNDAHYKNNYLASIKL